MKVLSSLLLPEFKEIIEDRNADAIAEAVEDLHAADVADLMQNLDDGQAAYFFETLPNGKRMETFEYTEEHEQARIYNLLGKSKMLSVIETMSSDSRAAFLRHLPPATVDALLPLIAQAERDDIKKLISYEPQTAGALMTTEYVSFAADLTVATALESIRKTAMSRETIYYIYVVDGAHNLTGVLSLKSLVVAAPTQKLAEIMTDNVVKVRADADRETAAETIRKYNLLAIPVTDNTGKLVGIITQDDAVDVIVKESTEDAHMMGGVIPFTQPYFKTPVLSLALKRVFWLSLLLFAETITITAFSQYEATLEKTIILAMFIPLILSTGGNSGSQSAVLITRALALGEIGISDWFRIFLREYVTGMLLGVVLGVIGAGIAIVWGGDIRIAATVGIGLISVVTCGTVIGSILPLFLKKLGFDPAISSSPFIASLCDVTGITVYFQIATMVVGS